MVCERGTQSIARGIPQIGIMFTKSARECLLHCEGRVKIEHLQRVRLPRTTGTSYALPELDINLQFLSGWISEGG